MKQLFQRKMTETELKLYNEAISYIKEKTEQIIDEIDQNIKTYNKFNNFEYKFYLADSSLSISDKKKYLKLLKDKIMLMGSCNTIEITVATKFHPMCWCYYISKHLKPGKIKDWINDKIMYGFCVPFYPSKPVMIAQYVFENGFDEVKDILSHELTHALLSTKDLNADNHIDALNDAWTIGLLF